MVTGRDGKASCAIASRDRVAAAAAAVPMTNWRRSILSLHLADRLYGRLDALGVRVPECSEFRLVHVGDNVTDVRDRRLELLGRDHFLGLFTHARDHRIRCALRREQTDPDRELDIVA